MSTERIHDSSLHMLVKDEIDLLPRLLEYINEWVDEIIIVDTGSTDGTLDLVRKYTPNVFQMPLNRNFSAARNFGLSKATKSWIFHLDADERPTESLLLWLTRFVGRRASTLYDGVSIHRHNLVGGNPIGRATHERHVRFFRNTAWYRFEGLVHEHINVPEALVLDAPRELLIEHYKTVERQNMQNAFYETLKE